MSLPLQSYVWVPVGFLLSALVLVINLDTTQCAQPLAREISEADAIRKKWGAQELVRDVEYGITRKEDYAPLPGRPRIVSSTKVVKRVSLSSEKIQPHLFAQYLENSEFPRQRHIKEDVKKIMSLQELGELNDYEALFYFFRMHDFDNNGLLDGHEMLAAMLHTTEHGHGLGEQKAETDLVPIVDSFMELDTNNDGYLTYSELRKNLDQDQKKKH